MHIGSQIPVRVEGKPIEVVLPDNISAFALRVAAEKTRVREHTPHREDWGEPDQSEEETDRGAIVAEVMCAFALQVEYTGYRWVKGKPDVGPIEVRAIHSKNHKLRVQPSDKDHAPYALVYVQDYTHGILCGWHWGWVVKQVPLWKPREDKPPMHLLEKDKLRKEWQMLRVMVWESQGRL